eukprot:scaffold50834_cov102-Phaeocystis_antarctica.AAC.5
MFKRRLSDGDLRVLRGVVRKLCVFGPREGPGAVPPHGIVWRQGDQQFVHAPGAALLFFVDPIVRAVPDLRPLHAFVVRVIVASQTARLLVSLLRAPRAKLQARLVEFRDGLLHLPATVIIPLTQVPPLLVLILVLEIGVRVLFRGRVQTKGHLLTNALVEERRRGDGGVGAFDGPADLHAPCVGYAFPHSNALSHGGRTVSVAGGDVSKAHAHLLRHRVHPRLTISSISDPRAMGAIGIPLALHAALDGSVVPREAAPRRHAFGLKACGVVGHLLLSHCHDLLVHLLLLELDAVNVLHTRLRASPTELHLRALGHGCELPFNVSSLSD